MGSDHAMHAVAPLAPFQPPCNVRRKKAAFSHSPLADPSTPIYALASRFQEFLHFPDPAPLYAVMGAMAGGMMLGDPVWLMLVGPPSCGKTELLMSLADIEGVKVEGSLTGETTLLSGTKLKDYKHGAKGGLLKELIPLDEHGHPVGHTHSHVKRFKGDKREEQTNPIARSKGCIIFKDFTSILSMEKKTFCDIMKALREIFDGNWSRRIGAEGSRALHWQGKCAVLGAVTPVIDRSHSLVNEMGERFIFYRYPVTGIGAGYGEACKALDKRNPAAERAEIREVVKDFFDLLDLSWKADPEKMTRKLKHTEQDGIIAMGMLAGACRGTVVRDYQLKEILDVPLSEGPTRMTVELGQLYLGMEFLGVEGGVGREAWRVVRKVALDSMPMVRKVAVECALVSGESGGYRTTQSEIMRRGRFSLGTAKRTTEDLVALEVMQPDKAGGFRLVEQAVELVRKVNRRG